MIKRTIQQKGFQSPVTPQSDYTAGYQRKHEQKLKPEGEKSDIDDFNYTYNKSASLYKTGDIPDKGVYVCTNCGNDVMVASGEHLPPCPRCGNLEFTLKQ